jgi:integrase
LRCPRVALGQTAFEQSWVCPGGRAGEPLRNLYKPWGRICGAAGAAGVAAVRPHDIRHSYVSVATAGGESLVVAGAIVGHSSADMTARYSHLSDDPVRAAADRISSAIAAAMSGADPAQVVTMSR